MRRALLALAITVLIVFSSADARAQAPSTNTIQVKGPASGMVASAAFETAGYRMQSIVLKQLEPLLNSLAVFLLVTGIAALLLSQLFIGKMERVQWLMVGPILFYFSIYTVTPGAGTVWRLGGMAGGSGALAGALSGTPLAPMSTSNVSWLFHTYNRLLSSVYQNLTGVFMNTNARLTMQKFFSRARILDDLLQTEAQSGGLYAFVVDTLMMCNREMDAARTIALGKRNGEFRETEQYRAALGRFDGAWKLRTKSILNSPSHSYLRDLLAPGVSALSDPGAPLYEECLNQTRQQIAAESGDLDRFLSRPVSCEQLWCWVNAGVRRTATARESELKERYGLTRDAFEKIKVEVSEKLSEPEPLTDVDGNLIMGIRPASPDASVIPAIVGGTILRNILVREIRGSAVATLTDNAGLRRQSGNFKLDGDHEFAREVVQRNVLHQRSESKKYELLLWGMNFPFIQGFFLYALATSFPFFALLLVLPGYSHGFISWFALWAWAKMWDVGWALVIVAENVLWDLMPHSSVYNFLADPQHGPISVFESAFQGDPSYSLANYYTIIGLMFGAVPIVSGQIVLRGKQMILGVMVEGLDQLNQSLSFGVGNWTGMEQTQHIDMLRENFLAKKAIEGFGHAANDRITQVRNKIAQVEATADRLAPLGAQQIPLEMAMISPKTWAEATISAAKGAQILRRAANTWKAELETVSTRFHYFNAGRERSYLNAEAIRAGTTGRGEFWNFPDVPTEAFATLEQMELDIDTRQAVVVARTQTQVGLAPIR